MKLRAFFFVGFTATIFWSSCRYDNPNDLTKINVLCDTTACYKNIKPIVMTNCAFTGCHVAGGIGVGDFSVFANFKNVANNGKLKYRINLDQANPDHMPKDGLLNATDIATLNDWINSGAAGCW